MTAPGLLDQLVTLLPSRAPSAMKAVTGPGAWSSSTYPQLSAFQRDPARMARQAQDVYLTNRHIRQAERLIAGRFATVDWHLEDADGNRVGRDDGDNADPAYLAVLDLLERPYRPQPGDPIAAAPKTRAALWNLTCRHTGLAGYGAWYLDEAEALAGTPRSLLYINPARLSPATDKGGALLGWVLDKDSPSGGTPLDTESVVVFHLEPPDTGHLGAGLVETAMSMVELTKHADRHATGVLAAGGRLSGVVAPKGTETMEEEVYQQLVLDFRRAQEDPASARRMNILRGPVEFHRLSATPSELDLVAVMNLSRDEVSELWNVPRSQVGGKGEGGLNSGESKGYDEAVLWQNAVGPRLRSFAETVQYELLDRWAELGVTVTLVIEEPEFDDETPLYERAAKAVTLPLTNKERREQVGLEPFNDERDDEVWMASTMTRVYPEPEPGPTPPQLAPFTGQRPPVPPDPDEVEDEREGDDEDEPTIAEDMGGAMKASMDSVRERGRSAMQHDLARLLERWGRDVAERVRDRAEHLARKPTDVDAVMSVERLERDLLTVLTPHLRAIAEGTGESVALSFGKAELRDAVLEQLLRTAGIRIKGIAETTRDRVRETVAKGIADGLSATELGTLLQTAGPFSELRAETIARTETMFALNDAALAQYAEFGVERVQAADGDEDEECAARDGQVFTVAEAASIIDHPNGTLTWIPLVGEPAKAAPVEVADLLATMRADDEQRRREEDEMNEKVAAALSELATAIKNQPAPVVQAPPPLLVPPPNVTIQAPEPGPREPRVFVIQRDPATGRAARIIEG